MSTGAVPQALVEKAAMALHVVNCGRGPHAVDLEDLTGARAVLDAVYEDIAVAVHGRWHRALEDPVVEPPGPIHDHIEQFRADRDRLAAQVQRVQDLCAGMLEPGSDFFVPVVAKRVLTALDGEAP